MTDLSEILDAAQAAVAEAADLPALDTLRVRFLGKKGVLTEQLKQLGALPPEQRPQFGQVINAAKVSLMERIEARRVELEREDIARRLEGERIDVTLPGRGERPGGSSPCSRKSDSRSPTVRRSKTIITTSRRSTFRRTTRRGPCTTRFISMPARYCAPTPRRCRYG